MQDYFDFLIDKALDMKDFEWVKELQHKKNTYIDNIQIPTEDCKKEYYNNTTVLEDMTCAYGNLTEMGIVNINFQSKDNILNSNIVECSEKYKKGEVARYKLLDEYEQTYVKGYWIGYIESSNQDDGKDLVGSDYGEGFLEGYRICENAYKITIENIKKANEKPSKKWWQFWL